VERGNESLDNVIRKMHIVYLDTIFCDVSLYLSGLSSTRAADAQAKARLHVQVVNCGL
jgi:hypothetical protein